MQRLEFAIDAKRRTLHFMMLVRNLITEHPPLIRNFNGTLLTIASKIPVSPTGQVKDASNPLNQLYPRSQENPTHPVTSQICTKR